VIDAKIAPRCQRGCGYPHGRDSDRHAYFALGMVLEQRSAELKPAFAAFSAGNRLKQRRADGIGRPAARPDALELATTSAAQFVVDRF